MGSNCINLTWYQFVFICLGFYTVSTVFQLFNSDSSQIHISWATVTCMYVICRCSHTLQCVFLDNIRGSQYKTPWGNNL